MSTVKVNWFIVFLLFLANASASAGENEATLPVSDQSMPPGLLKLREMDFHLHAGMERPVELKKWIDLAVADGRKVILLLDHLELYRKTPEQYDTWRSKGKFEALYPVGSQGREALFTDFDAAAGRKDMVLFKGWEVSEDELDTGLELAALRKADVIGFHISPRNGSAAPNGQTLLKRVRQIKELQKQLPRPMILFHPFPMRIENLQQTAKSRGRDPKSITVEDYRFFHGDEQDELIQLLRGTSIYIEINRDTEVYFEDPVCREALIADTLPLAKSGVQFTVGTDNHGLAAAQKPFTPERYCESAGVTATNCNAIVRELLATRNKRIQGRPDGNEVNPGAAGKSASLNQSDSTEIAPWPSLKEVIIVSKTHFDIGYTDLASRVVDRYRTTMADQALKLVEESRTLPSDQQFSWTLAGWPMAQILWPGQTPERREGFLTAMRNGRLVPHALPFTTHTESLDLEDLTRGLSWSVELARLAGRPAPAAAKMTDVVSHTRVTATILAQAGVKFFHLGCNEGCSRPEVPLLYWWEGPDGSRVLTMCSAAYGSGLCPPPDWPYKTWLCMWMTGDNHGPPNAVEVQRLFAQARKDLPGVRVRFGQMSDFAEAILRENPQLPVIRGDTPDTWIHGIGSMPIETQLAHTTRPRIAALEALDTLLDIWGASTGSAAEVVREAYENTLLFGEHTWGPDVPRYAGYRYGEEWKRELAAGRYKFLLEGFDQKRAYARKAAAVVDRAIADRMTALASAVQVPGQRIVVFNPLPWTRDGEVELLWGGAATDLKDAASGEVLAGALSQGKLHFVARKLPPLGYRTYVTSAKPVAKETVIASSCIENDFFRVTLDAGRCGISSILCKKTGREMVNTQSPYALGQYLYERFDADQAARFTSAYVLSPKSGEMISHGKPKLPPASEHPYCAGTATEASVEIRSNAVCVTALLKVKPRGSIPDETQLRVTLYAVQPWVDLEWSIANKTPDPWPEGGWLCFPLRADDPAFRLARLGSIVDPAKDLVPGSNHELFCLNGGLVVKGAGGGATGICPIDAQLVSLEHPGLWRYTRDFIAHKADVFLSLFNNVYSTNFGQWIEGSWSSRVRLWAIEEGESCDESLIGASWEARVSCVASVSEAPPGKLPALAQGMAISRAQGASAGRGLLVTAFGRNPYGEGTLLRLWEQIGNAGACGIQLPTGMKARTAQFCNLRGEITGPSVPILESGTLNVTLRPMAPASVILR
jgi:alpha-mannosidase